MTEPTTQKAQPDPTFRDRALGDNPNPLEHIDHLFKHTARRLWIGILGLAILLGAGVVWTVVATQALTMTGPALVVPEAGLYAVGTGKAGFVRDLLVDEGDVVGRGQTLAVLDGPDGSPAVIRSPVDGVVVSQDLRLGDTLSGADPAFRIAPDTPPVGIALVPADQVSRIRVGMPASLTVNGVSRAEYGVVTGEVSYISSIAVSAARLQQISGDDSLLALPQQLGALREVRVVLDEADTPSGLSWSRGSGPLGALPVGVRGQATIEVGRERIISKAFR